MFLEALLSASPSLRPINRLALKMVCWGYWPREQEVWWRQERCAPPRFVTALSPTTTLPSAKNVTTDLDIGQVCLPHTRLSSLCSERQELLSRVMVWYDGDGLETMHRQSSPANIRLQGAPRLLLSMPPLRRLSPDQCQPPRRNKISHIGIGRSMKELQGNRSNCLRSSTEAKRGQNRRNLGNTSVSLRVPSPHRSVSAWQGPPNRQVPASTAAQPASTHQPAAGKHCGPASASVGNARAAPRGSDFAHRRLFEH